jgi:hypothetical protein
LLRNVGNVYSHRSENLDSLFFTAPIFALGVTQPPIKCVPGYLLLGMTLPGRYVRHAPLSAHASLWRDVKHIFTHNKAHFTYAITGHLPNVVSYKWVSSFLSLEYWIL